VKVADFLKGRVIDSILWRISEKADFSAEETTHYFSWLSTIWLLPVKVVPIRIVEEPAGLTSSTIILAFNFVKMLFVTMSNIEEPAVVTRSDTALTSSKDSNSQYSHFRPLRGYRGSNWPWRVYRQRSDPQDMAQVGKDQELGKVKSWPSN
jgi:hypothetical protein